MNKVGGGVGRSGYKDATALLKFTFKWRGICEGSGQNRVGCVCNLSQGMSGLPLPYPQGSPTPGAWGALSQKIKGRSTHFYQGPQRGLWGRYVRNTPADKFLSRKVDREQHISCFACANPRRSQAGTRLRSRSLRLPGPGLGAAWRSRWTVEECGRREWEKE